MGYRSQVGLCLTAQAYELFQKALAVLGADSKQAEVVRSLMAHADNEGHDAETGAHLWYWSYLKWYASYLDVSFIENFINTLEGEEYSFIRVGEDDDDSEIGGDFWDNPFDMYFSRGIDFDIPTAQAK
jgi:hypothetical protein